MLLQRGAAQQRLCRVAGLQKEELLGVAEIDLGFNVLLPNAVVRYGKKNTCSMELPYEVQA